MHHTRGKLETTVVSTSRAGEVDLRMRMLPGIEKIMP